MSVLEYRDPVTGQWIEVCGNVTSIGGAAEELLKPMDFPDYVRTEVAAVAARVREVLTEDSIVSVTVSDTHYPGDEAGYSDEYYTNESTPHLCMAVKALGYLLPIDFIAHLGDIGRGHGSDTPDALKKQNTDFLAWFKEATGKIPAFALIGNHDSGIYYHDGQSDGVHTLSGDWLFENQTALAASENTVFAGQEYGGYGYRDFPEKKLRVFFLNTSERLIYDQTDNATMESQRTWLTTALNELNAKSDAAQWKWIVLSHYPADYGATMPLSELLKTYVGGAARFLCQLHGHVHNLLSDRLAVSVAPDYVPVKYDGWRLCVPNGQHNRENYYTGEYAGISYHEPQSYPKTPNTAEDTSFTVNVINPSEDKIYSFVYGAGYDREIGIGATIYYSVTMNLTNATVTGGASSVEAGAAYSATVSAASGYELDTVKVTMGGADITATAYANGVITISGVTGNVAITATAIKAPTSNLHLIAEAADSTAPYNGCGYKNGVYLSNDADQNVTDTSPDDSIVTTGFIPYQAPATGLPPAIEISGAEWQAISHCRMFFISGDKRKINTPWIRGNIAATDYQSMEYNYTIETLGNKHFRLVPKLNAEGTDWTASGGAGSGTSMYVRFSLVGTGENLIINIG